MSLQEDAMVREWISKNNYVHFVENKKLIIAWLKLADYDAMLFFVRCACCMSMFDIVHTWIGDDAFVFHMKLIEDQLYPHQIQYIQKLIMPCSV